MSDEPRFLHRKSEHGYTDRLGDALELEPEAVPADYQVTLTARARRRERVYDLAAWRVARTRIAAELEALDGLAKAHNLSSDLRAISRVLERVDKRLSA